MRQEKPASHNQDQVAAAAEPQALQPSKTKRKLTARQLAARQANGRKSSGPATPEGRTKCSEAARSQFTHDMLAGSVLLVGESKARFVGLVQSYVAILKPRNELEHNTIQRMAVAYWKNLRFWSLEQTRHNCEIVRQNEDLPPPHRVLAAERSLGKEATASRRYETVYERQFRNAMRDFEFLKKLREPTDGLVDIPVPVAGSTWEHREDEDMEE